MPFLTTALALALVVIDAAFSVIGLRDFFNSAPDLGTVIGMALVAVKVTVAARLKANWPTVTWLRRAWGIGLAGGIMLLTSASTYTYLSAAHAGLAAGRDATAQQVAGIEDRIKLHQRALDGAQQEEAALSRIFDGYLAAGKVSRADAARKDDADQLAEIRRRIEREQAAIEQGQAERAAAQQQLAGETAKLGPAKILADLTGGDEILAAKRAIGWLMMMFEAALIYMSGEAVQAWQKRRQVPTVAAEPMAPIALPAVAAEVSQTDQAVTEPPAELMAAEPGQAVLESAGAGEGELVETDPPKVSRPRPKRRARGKRGPDKAPRKSRNRKIDEPVIKSTADAGQIEEINLAAEAAA